MTPLEHQLLRACRLAREYIAHGVDVGPVGRHLLPELSAAIRAGERQQDSEQQGSMVHGRGGETDMRRRPRQSD